MIEQTLGLFYRTPCSESKGIIDEVLLVKRLCSYLSVHHEMIYHVAEVVKA